jgi:4'-phosphopantetheinyl transferase EntD
MQRIVPDCVAVVEHSGPGFTDGIRPEEALALGQVVERRYREFATGRDCAHRGLAQLGAPDIPVLPGPNREPIWPDGYVGSITHCDGYCAAAVARVEQIVSLGIDAEPIGPLPDHMRDLIAFDDERRWLKTQADAGSAKLLFSAKESVFKAWFPLTGRWLGFEDVRVAFEPGSKTFAARLLPAGPVLRGKRLQAFRGRYAVTDRLLLTAVVVQPGQFETRGSGPPG